MIILRGLLSRKELFRLLFKLKGKEEELSVLWLEGGKSFEYKGLKIRKPIFVPKPRGDLYYWAYLSKGFGRQVYVEGYEEFEEKVNSVGLFSIFQAKIVLCLIVKQQELWLIFCRGL